MDVYCQVEKESWRKRNPVKTLNHFVHSHWKKSIKMCAISCIGNTNCERLTFISVLYRWRGIPYTVEIFLTTIASPTGLNTFAVMFTTHRHRDVKQSASMENRNNDAQFKTKSFTKGKARTPKIPEWMTLNNSNGLLRSTLERWRWLIKISFLLNPLSFIYVGTMDWIWLHYHRRWISRCRSCKSSDRNCRMERFAPGSRRGWVISRASSSHGCRSSTYRTRLAISNGNDGRPSLSRFGKQEVC